LIAIVTAHREDARLTTGSKVHDARIAALCLQHGVKELLTADRAAGFRR
jgi:predicted nucleic acid-binding protein